MQTKYFYNFYTDEEKWPCPGDENTCGKLRKRQRKKHDECGMRGGRRDRYDAMDEDTDDDDMEYGRWRNQRWNIRDKCHDGEDDGNRRHRCRFDDDDRRERKRHQRGRYDDDENDEDDETDYC